MSKRGAFVSTVSHIMDDDEQVILCLGDISVFAFRDAFIKHPKRCFNFSTTEQASVGACAGLAMSGLYPVYHTISSFLIRRAFEFLHIGFGLQQLPGLFVGVGGAADYASLGATHCADAEIELAQHAKLPALKPRNEAQVAAAITDAVRHRECLYLSIEEGV